MMMACKGNATARLDDAQKGITLIETLVVITLLAILTAIAVPSFKDIILNRRLEGKAREYVTHMNWARSLAVSSNQAVNLRIATGGNASCYVIFQGPLNDCSCNASGAACTTPSNERLVVVLPHSNGIRVSARTESATTQINPRLGTITPTLTAIFTADNGKAIHNISNILGRTRSCMPTEASFGFRMC